MPRYLSDMKRADNRSRTKNTNRFNLNKSSIILGAVGVILIGFIWFIFSTIWISAAHFFIAFLMHSVFVMLMILLALIFFGLGTFFYYRNKDKLWIAGMGLGVLAVLGIITGLFFQAYWNHVATLEASNVVYQDDANQLSYENRIPLEVAKSVSARSLGDSTGDMIDSIKSNPDQGTYTTAIIRRGIFQGYESVVQMKLPEYGTFNFDRDIKICDFSENATRRFDGGGFNNSITYKMLDQVPGWNPSARINDDDVYMFCDGDTPMIYAPIIKTKISFPGAYDYQAGVVSYNGKTGEFKYYSEMKDTDFPVYSIDLAAQQRESLNASNGYINWFMGRSGYEGTNKDEEDVNSANSTEFALENTKGETLYVTPLTPRGSSSSVVGLSEVGANSFTKGVLNQIVVHNYKTPKQAPSTIAETIVASVLSGYKANGLTVFEVVPNKDGHWTATIGKNQSILYRADIDNSDNISLYDARGNLITNSVSANEGNDTENGQDLTNKPLDQMSETELKELMDNITNELINRIDNSGEN